MPRTLTFTTLTLLIAAAAAAATQGPSAEPALAETLAQGDPSAPGEAAGTGASAETPATDAELAELVAGNTDFAIALYQRLASEPGNLFISPHSISTALAMTYAGARGDTARQMAETLHYTLPPERLAAAFDRLASELAGRAAVTDPDQEGQRFQLDVANALWPQSGYPFLDDYMRAMREHYGAEPHPVDYENNAEEARQTINGWVAEQTHDRIPELIPSGVLGPLTRLVLTNTIYFTASWLEAFEESATHDGTFHAPAGDVTARMMSGRVRVGYHVGDGLTVVELPYLGGDIVMDLVMPAEGELGDFEGALDRAGLDALLGSLRHGEVDLTLPKFESGSAISLKATLTALGMPLPFELGADFSAMTGTRDLRIDEVIHQANITVDESGTEAAAATAVIMVGRSAAIPEEPPHIDIDRPFTYVIRDRETGGMLFMGRLLDPS